MVARARHDVLLLFRIQLPQFIQPDAQIFEIVLPGRATITRGNTGERPVKCSGRARARNFARRLFPLDIQLLLNLVDVEQDRVGLAALKALAEALLEKEVLDAPEIDKIIQGAMSPIPQGIPA